MTRGRSQAKLFEKKKQVIVKVQSLKRMQSRRASLVRKRAMLVKVQAHARMKAASKWRVDVIKTIIQVQAAYRGLVVRNRYLILKEARKQWKKFLSPNEAVVFASLVRKEAGGGIAKILGFKKRRQLLLTSKPRFLYVDPNDDALRGDIDATNDDVHIELASSEDGKTGSQDFVLITAARDYSFTDLLGEAKQWKETLLRYQDYRRVSQRSSALGSRALLKSLSRKETDGEDGKNEDGKNEAKEVDASEMLPMCIGVGDMLRNGWGIQESLLVQGFLTKQSVKGRFGKKWTRRWFVLHNGILYYFKSDANKPHCWRITTTEVPTGILMYAIDAQDKRRWMDAIRHAINAKHKAHRDSIRSSLSLKMGQRPSLLQEIKHGRKTSDGLLLRSGVSPEDLC
eukprot:g274.t1